MKDTAATAHFRFLSRRRETCKRFLSEQIVVFSGPFDIASDDCRVNNRLFFSKTSFYLIEHGLASETLRDRYSRLVKFVVSFVRAIWHIFSVTESVN